MDKRKWRRKERDSNARIERLKNTVDKYKQELQKLKEECYVSAFLKVVEKAKEKDLAASILVEQVHNFAKKKPTWSEVTMRHAVVLRNLSTRAYGHCHLIKNVRSQFLSRDIGKGGEISANHLKNLYRMQQGSLVKPVRFLTRKHVFSTNMEKMNVQRAVQVCSPPVTVAMKLLQEQAGHTCDTSFAGVGPTVQFMDTVHRWLVLMDVSNCTQHIHQKNADCKRFESAGDERLIWLETSFLDYLDDLKSQCLAKNFLTKETYEGVPRVADAEPNGYVGARVRTDRSCKMTDLSAQRGYDPDAMAWATIRVPEGEKSVAADPIRNEELFRMVERHSQRKAMKMATSAPPAGKAPSTQTGSATRAAQGSGAKRSKPTTTWKPKPLPRPHPEDFVVIIKPREPVALRDVFQRGALGAAFATLVGVQKAATLNLLLAPEQNLIIASTREAQTADQLLGDFELQTYKGKMAVHGHLKQHGEDVCYGVVTVANHETTDTLRQALHTIPACGLCGTVGHRADSCPNPANAKCGLCGQQAELVEGVRTPRECNPKCAVCGGSHVTNSRECTAKYRQPKMTTPQQSGLPKSWKKTRHHAAFSHGGSRHVDVTTQQTPPRGGDVKGQAAQEQPPHDAKGNRGQQQQQRKDRSEIWQRANAVKYGKQVSGPGGAASPFQSPSLSYSNCRGDP
ncbi:hypothetical protein HPB49_024127 [Dermacentor silvarum]|uniref:Uncharacterized protein n=1 Tax=Dermacentor silvarum TaxID=543639 RepID=A0ACB8DH82_DERSI|nr:hypothetical protein HPB49_024127 [Dermacentor silvarum]